MEPVEAGLRTRIALIGAGGMSFGPVMVHDAIRSQGIAGATLALIDNNEGRLEESFAVADRLNKSAGEPISLEKTVDLDAGLEGCNFVLISVEQDRFNLWKQDYVIPVRYGSGQINGESGGPGGLFHALRSIKLVMSICERIEAVCPDAMVINLTNPLPRVLMAIQRGTKLNAVGLCHEYTLGIVRLAIFLTLPLDKLDAAAAGTNHFSFFHRIQHKDTGEDLYPRLRRHMRWFPFLYSPLVRNMFKKYGVIAITTDNHIGEYVPYAKKIVGSHIDYRKLMHYEWELKNALTKAYARGLLPIPVSRIPRSYEQAFPLIEAIATGETAYLDAVNVPNRGYIPNLPDGMIVEVPANAGAGGVEPVTCPPIQDELAELMEIQGRIQELTVESALKGDPALAFEALELDPLSPTDESLRRQLFDEMVKMQKEYLPF